MTVDYILEGDCLSARYSGMVTCGDVQEAAEFAWSHPGWDNIERIRVDFTDATGSDLDLEKAQVLAFMHAAAVERHRPIRYAIIVTLPDLAALCEGHAKVVTDAGYDCALFDSREAADAYLSDDGPA